MSEENKTQNPVEVKAEKSAMAQNEERVLEFWRVNKTFEKSLAKNKRKGLLDFFKKDEFVFYDGPPFATGLPHYGHILVSAIKDAIPRYKTMRGFRVPRRWGWDCHGLPIENIVEKDLGISGRKQIEQYGIDKFNIYAKTKVLTYVNEWRKTVERMGRWVDFDGSYKTMDSYYIESVWWALKELYKKGLVYEGTRVLPYCPRCETPIANSEIAMDNSYKDISDISVYAKFPVKNGNGKYFLAWTTTPWTLPGNFALAVNPSASYVEVEIETEEGKVERLVMAKDRLPALKFKAKIISEMQGVQLVGQSYEPPFNYFEKKDFPNKDRAWKVYAGDFVTMTDGTGIVHIAPGYGEDDINLAKKEKIPFIHHVDNEGKFKEAVSDFAGRKVKPKENPQEADIEIIKFLAKAGRLLAKEKIVHPYPHCYRCDTPLYYYAIPAWFVKIQSLRDKLISLNEKINWIPAHLKHGRFEKGLQGAPDWNISRNRFWASPLPFWKCGKCGKLKILGGRDELSMPAKNNYVAIRHGQAENNVGQITSSLFETPHCLTDKGRAEVKSACLRLRSEKIDVIFYSPLVRTKETAAIIAEELGLGKDALIADERLREVGHGNLEGKPISEYRKAAGDDWLEERFVVQKDGVESYNMVRRRIGELFVELENKYSGKNILFVSHDVVIWLMEAVSRGLSAGEAVRIRSIGTDAVKNAEIRKIDFRILPRDENFELELHRPFIDSVKFKCTCGGEMKRVEEVVDCWFESGSMPFASNHYPFENRDWKRKRFPADFVAEYVPQTRTWFYYMHVLASVLFGDAPFKNVLTHGTILAEDGQKMSKSKGNFPDPWLIFDKYSVDALRFYLLSSPTMKAEDLNFSERGVDEVSKKVLNRLENVLSFYLLYTENQEVDISKASSKKVLDVWIVGRLAETLSLVTESIEKYELDRATRPIADFVDDLSVWYLRRSRERFKGEDLADRSDALKTLGFVLAEFSKIIAPFMPFMAEFLYQKIHYGSLEAKMDRGSVHLENWPTVGNLAFSKGKDDLMDKMTTVRDIVSKALELRSKARIRVRQPLATLKVSVGNAEIFNNAELTQLIKDEVNVKAVIFDEKMEEDVFLDTTVTPELKEEGVIREVIRAIQDLRKKSGLTIKDKARLEVESSQILRETIERNFGVLKNGAGLKEIVFVATLPGEAVEIEPGQHLRMKLFK